MTVENQALNYETLHITIRANTTTITTQTITLTSQSQTTFTIPWDTTSVAKGNYNITAQATILPYEIDTNDNTLSAQVKVTIPGDINGDFFVNIIDATQIGINWLKFVPPTPPNVDINDDTLINIKDATIVGINWLKDP